MDLSNCSESLDEELLQLVGVCERLEQLKVWAFFEVNTVERLLNMRLTQSNSLNKINVRDITTARNCSRTEMYLQANAQVDHYVFQVRIYTVHDTREQEDQLEETSCVSHLHSPSYSLPLPRSLNPCKVTKKRRRMKHEIKLFYKSMNKINDNWSFQFGVVTLMVSRAWLFFSGRWGLWACVEALTYFHCRG